jgi:hypothetical protein
VSLNNPRIIFLLNRYYVPVFTSNEDYQGSGPAPPEERAALERIRREGYDKKLSVGTVHVYVLGPDGHLRDSLHIARADPETLGAMLENNARALGTAGGAPALRPVAPAPPACPAGALQLHLVARYLEKRGDALVPVENAGGNWSALPGEDWITLRKPEWTCLLPPDKTPVGQTWEVDAAVAVRLLTYFYPPTENNDAARNRFTEMTLRATLLGPGRVQLAGTLRMEHPFYREEDGKFVAARVSGFLDFDPKTRAIQSFQMATERADYGGKEEGRLPFGVAVRSVR